MRKERVYGVILSYLSWLLVEQSTRRPALTELELEPQLPHPVDTFTE